MLFPQKVGGGDVWRVIRCVRYKTILIALFSRSICPDRQFLHNITPRKLFLACLFGLIDNFHVFELLRQQNFRDFHGILY